MVVLVSKSFCILNGIFIVYIFFVKMYFLVFKEKEIFVKEVFYKFLYVFIL